VHVCKVCVRAIDWVCVHMPVAQACMHSDNRRVPRPPLTAARTHARTHARTFAETVIHSPLLRVAQHVVRLCRHAAARRQQRARLSAAAQRCVCVCVGGGIITQVRACCPCRSELTPACLHACACVWVDSVRGHTGTRAHTPRAPATALNLSVAYACWLRLRSGCHCSASFLYAARSAASSASRATPSML
jgi:hypothetical protein